MEEEEKWADPNTQAVAEMMRKRMEFGLNKYGITTAEQPFGFLEWLQHLQEELCDAAVYVECLKNLCKNGDLNK